MPNIQAVRGTKDILPDEAARFEHLERTARSVFSRFGFSEIRTPTFESLELFQRSLGETTDVVQKEMYVFEDRGGRKLALRPEGTAGVVRAFVEHHLSQTAPFCKLFYMGPMYRAERPQAGRYREFWQAGAESFGNPSPAADAEMVLMIQALFKDLGLQGVTLKLNSLGDAESRARYVDALKGYLSGRRGSLCEDCQRRIDQNPLRALDCKADGPAMDDAPTIDRYWADAPRRQFERLCRYLDIVGSRYLVMPRLVRGLDYYTGPVFEFVHEGIGAQNALAAGGRYDTLVHDLGGPAMPALGFAMGIERTLEALKSSAPAAASGDPKPLFVFMAAIGEAASEKALALMQDLRRDVPTLRVDGGFFDKKLGAQLQMAAKIGATHAVILGEDELSRQSATVRDLATGAQTAVSFNALPSVLQPRA